jgi:hypothetical protein
VTLRTIEHIRAELDEEGLSSASAPWAFEDDEVEREAERRYRLRVEIEEWCAGRTIERIKLEYNPGFAKFGLRLTRIPGWRAA